MWDQIRSNQRKSVFLIIIMAAVLFVIGYFLGEILSPGGGRFGLVLAVIIWFIMTLFAFFSGDTVFLKISGAKKITQKDHPILFNIVEEMTIAAGLPKVPDIYIIDEAAPNAFATGRKPEKASVAVTAGLLEILSRDELQGVIAHELAHIKNRDVLYMMMVGVMMGAIIILADIGVRHLFWSSAYRRTSSRGSQQGQAQIIMLAIAIVLIILAPLIAQLIYFAVSRKREYLADASSVQFTRYPEGLADALEKISKKPIKLRAATRATAPLFIVNPLKLTKTGLKNATSTHPPIDQRVKILRSMGGVNQSISFDKYNESFCRITGRKVGVVPFNLEEDTASMGKKPSIIDGRSKHDRVRETTDMLWKLNEYIFITCACGAKLKIPPSYKGKNIPCPHCKEEHNI